MHTEEPLIELVSGHCESATPLQEAVFTYIDQNEVIEKARCYLYDTYIIIKLRVIPILFRKLPRNKSSESSSASILSSNCCGKRTRRRNWADRLA